MNHYERLGVASTATQQEIKTAYRSKALQHHPDLHRDRREHQGETFLDIKKAYEVLINPRERARYDEQLTREAANSKSHKGPSEGPSPSGTPFSSNRSAYTDEHAAAWEADKSEAQSNKIRSEQRHHKTTQARFERRARHLRRFWQSHTGITWYDILVVSLFFGCSYGLWSLTRNPVAPSKLKLKAKDV